MGGGLILCVFPRCLTRFLILRCRLATRASQCALAVMAKAPRPGKVKTRLAPPLTLEQVLRLTSVFCGTLTENIAAVAASGACAGVISYTPVGDEALFDNLLPADFALIPQRGDGFGERLLATARRPTGLRLW